MIVSLAIHAGGFYLALHSKWTYKMFTLRETRTDALIVSRPPIRFTGQAGAAAAPAGSPEGRIDAPPGARLVPPGGPERAGAASGGATGPPSGGPDLPPGGSSPPIGGSTGWILGRGGGTGVRDREGEDLGTRFSLIYPADAMLNLAKYAQVPEDEWLRSYRSTSTPPRDFSRYVYPEPGSRGAPSGTGAPGGRFAPVQPVRPAAVAAVVPENVRVYDLSAWADEALKTIQKEWTLGADAGAAEWSGQVSLTVLVMKGGEVVSVEMTGSSKIESLDRSARAAMDACSSLPPLPSDFPDSSLEIQFVFKYGR